MAKLVKERVDDLEKEVAELKLIVHQLRESNITLDDVKRHLNIEDTLSIVEDTIEFEGKKYKKVDRLAREGDVVVFYGSEHPRITNGKFYEIYRHKTEGFLYHKSDSGSDYSLDGDYVEGWHVYELTEQPTVMVKGPLMAHVHEVAEKPKTANELRGEIIEKAKGFVEEHIKPNAMTKSWRDKGAIHWNGYGVLPKFFINEDKRIVTLILRGAGNAKEIFKRTFAKCMPGDVFNAHIGKAIALGRALNIDVSEFEQAVQPTEFAKGQLIKADNLEMLGIHEITEVSNSKAYFNLDGAKEFHYKWRIEEPTFHITNDTNAIYGGVE